MATTLAPGDIAELEASALAIRRASIQALYHAQGGHAGGALSLVEIVTLLFRRYLRLDPQRPAWPERDRFVLSKGHGCLALYGALAGRGFFPWSAFDGFDHVNGILQGHPDRLKTPGVEISTGTLGQGLSVGIGMALGLRMDQSDAHVYVAMGDGELQEGQVWEAAMAAPHFGLDNLTAIVDRNRLQLGGPTEKFMALEPLCDRWTAFGWNVIEADGHDYPSLAAALDGALATRDRPTIVIAHTVKGKGVSYMENRAEWHARPITPAEFAQAMSELGGEA